MIGVIVMMVMIVMIVKDGKVVSGHKEGWWFSKGCLGYGEVG